MTTVDSWPVEVSLREEDGQTQAEALLTRDGVGLIGHGLARRHPEDQEVTQIGEEIAAARAVSDLAHQLLSDAAGQIEGITHQRAHLSL
jgi:Rv2632c-like